MKAKRITIAALTLLPLIVGLIALSFLPDEIPAHYGINLTVDRFGSKYESLITPFIALFFGIIFVIASLVPKKEQTKKLSLNIGLAFMLTFNAFDFCILYIQANNVVALDESPLRFDSVSMLIIGCLLIFLGNIMPMSRRNAFVGLRTPWSLKNDNVWKKSQIFDGASMIIVGLICAVLAFFYPNLFVMLGLVMLTAVIDTAYTYIIAKNNG